MKLLAIFILRVDDDGTVKILQKQSDLSSFGYFQRGHIESFLVFSARTVVERTDRGIRQSIELKENVNGMIHVYVGSDGLASAVISDNDYPKRVAHNLLNRVKEGFSNAYPTASWQNMAEGSGKMTSLHGMLMKYQNPQEADPLMSLQKDLDETKGILYKTLDNVLRRGEAIDELIVRSNDLSFLAKQFARTAKKTNQCCTLF